MPSNIKLTTSLICLAAFVAGTSPAWAQKSKKHQDEQDQISIPVGRISDAPLAPPPPPTPTTTIGQAVTASADHTTLNRLLQAAQLGITLSQPGPLTLFAPDDGAFSRLAPGTVDTLLKPENAASLADILKFHIVRGAIGVDDLKKMIAAGGGTATLTTIQGQSFTATEASGTVLLTDTAGNKSYVAKPDEKESNGVLQFVNGVLTPKLGAPSQAAPAAGAMPATEAAPAAEPAPTAEPDPATQPQ